MSSETTCPVCADTARYSCFEDKHVTACSTCATCFSPKKHTRCLWCNDTLDSDWDHESWMLWYQEQAKESTDPEVARILEMMGDIDIMGGAREKDINKLVEGMGETKIDDKKK
ncbi:hypothetical protein BJX65DRAFT_312516 [Aspergillus insuetus]